MNDKYKFIILANEQPDDHLLWQKACDDFPITVDYKVVNLLNAGWLNKIRNSEFDYLLARPPGVTNEMKKLYDERIFLLSEVLNFPVFPTYNEILLYENKRMLYSWLEANNLPHPTTNIFYSLQETLDFLNNCNYPQVAKTNIGASGSGVKILKSLKDAVEYSLKTFKSGAPRRWGPNLEKGDILKRIKRVILDPVILKKRLNLYTQRRNETQSTFVILQEFIKHEFEWRIVVIGKSYFAHKKLKEGQKASGSLLKNYDNPPLYLFDFAKDLVDKYNLNSQAIDVFESPNGEIKINELQCIFGQSDQYQMLVDGKPGRYINVNGGWKFEEGWFNLNESYNLRVESIIDLIENTKRERDKNS